MAAKDLIHPGEDEGSLEVECCFGMSDPEARGMTVSVSVNDGVGAPVQLAVNQTGHWNQFVAHMTVEQAKAVALAILQQVAVVEGERDVAE